jgi:hypothetical protein
MENYNAKATSKHCCWPRLQSQGAEKMLEHIDICGTTMKKLLLAGTVLVALSGAAVANPFPTIREARLAPMAFSCDESSKEPNHPLPHAEVLVQPTD